MVRMITSAFLNEAIEVSSDKPYHVWLAYWHFGQPHKVCWRDRLRHIWGILKTGSPYADMVILNKAQALELANAITEEANGLE